MKIAKYSFLILIIFLTSSIAGLIFYDAAIKVHDKKIVIINFEESTEVDFAGTDDNLDIFEVKELTHSSLADAVVQIENKDYPFTDFNLRHEKIFLTVSSLDICYVQSELTKAGKFETLKELTSDKNIVRVKDEDYHVKTLADLSRGRSYNYQYILPVECSLSPEAKLEEINQYIDYDPAEQRALLKEALDRINESDNVDSLEKMAK